MSCKKHHYLKNNPICYVCWCCVYILHDATRQSAGTSDKATPPCFPHLQLCSEFLACATPCNTHRSHNFPNSWYHSILPLVRFGFHMHTGCIASKIQFHSAKTFLRKKFPIRRCFSWIAITLHRSAILIPEFRRYILTLWKGEQVYITRQSKLLHPLVMGA